MCRQLWWKMTLDNIESYVGIATSQEMSDLFLKLPLSRLNEYEADRIGMVLLSKACFNLEAGVEVLTILKTHRAASPVPNWLQHWSSHPHSDARIANLRAHLAAVLQASPCHYSTELKQSLLSVPGRVAPVAG